MNFRQLEIYRAVMTSKSASRASELLEISQPAVSRSIADLEASVEFALFDRVRGRLMPTPEGKLFFKEVAASFSGLDRLRAEAARIRDFGSGSIRIASLAALGSTLVPRAIGAFCRTHPNITFTLQVRSSTAVRDLVASGQFDIGLAADEIDLSGVEHRTFQSNAGVCALPATHPLTRKDKILAEDLDRVPFVALSPEDRARLRLTAALDAVGSRPQIIVETPNSATVCAMVLEGVGVGIVNPGAVDGFVERGLVFRPFEPEVQFRSYLLFRPDSQRAKNVKAFTEALLEERIQRT